MAAMSHAGWRAIASKAIRVGSTAPMRRARFVGMPVYPFFAADHAQHRAGDDLRVQAGAAAAHIAEVEAQLFLACQQRRSEESRVGKGCDRPCRTRVWLYIYNQK